MPYDVIVIGTSWGGLRALSTLVEGLPAGFEVPLVVIQHRGRDGESLLVKLLQDHTALRVQEVEDKDPIEPGRVYVAPPDYHLLLELGSFSLSTDPPVRFSRPSIDVTFESVADTYGARSIGVVLTGANEDGAAGLKRVAERGGYAIVQDPATAESAIMPDAAIRAVPSAHVVALHQIAPHLAALAGAARPA